MYYHRRPAFALLLYIFQPYLKAISEIRLINTALVFSFPSSEWMKEGVQNYLELWPCQAHFLWLRVRGYANENSFQMCRAWKSILQRFATFHSLGIHKLSPQATQWKIASSIPLFQVHLRRLQKTRPIVLVAAGEKNPCFSEELGLLLNGWCKTSCFWAPLLQSEDSRGQLHTAFWSFFLPIRGKISVCKRLFCLIQKLRPRNTSCQDG